MSSPGSAARELVHPEDRAAVGDALAQVWPIAGSVQRFEVRVRDSAGAWRHLDAVATNLAADPDVAGIVVHARDITEQRSAEALVEHQRLHDPLTGCPNRALLVTQLERSLAREARHGRGVAVFAIELDRFASINKTHGHDAGDAVLVAIAQRIEATLRGYDLVSRPGPVVSRLGGDEFLALCEDVGDRVNVAAIGLRLGGQISEPVVVGGSEIIVTATIGVAVHHGDGGEPDTLLAQAQSAMHRAKQSGVGRIELFDDATRRAMDLHEQEVAGLRAAIDNGELRLHYQPKVNTSSGRVLGVEALVRWERPGHGLVPPAAFIGLAEESGLIGDLGLWVMREACRQQAAWALELGDAAPPVVAFNVSGHQLTVGFTDELRDTLEKSGALPEALCLELTESVVMRDVDTSVAVMQDIKALGISLAVDDFGTGHSSLSQLKRFPIDEVKIDKSFVDGLGVDPGDTAIVAATVAMAHALGLLVVAEGVETTDQLEHLRDLGCEMAQGYLFSRPVPADDLVLLGPVLRPAGAVKDGAAPPSSQLVLIVDDTEDVRQLAAVSLTTSGYAVVEATTGHDALREALRVRPACVVLDVSMPGIDGFEVCRRLRANADTRSTAIVMLTSRADADDKIAAFSSGADDYLVKPFAPRDLVARVQQAINRRAGG